MYMMNGVQVSKLDLETVLPADNHTCCALCTLNIYSLSLGNGQDCFTRKGQKKEKTQFCFLTKVPAHLVHCLRFTSGSVQSIFRDASSIFFQEPFVQLQNGAKAWCIYRQTRGFTEPHFLSPDRFWGHKECMCALLVHGDCCFKPKSIAVEYGVMEISHSQTLHIPQSMLCTLVT